MVKPWEWRSSGSFVPHHSSSAWRICDGVPYASGAVRCWIPRFPESWRARSWKSTSGKEGFSCVFFQTPLSNRHAPKRFNRHFPASLKNPSPPTTPTGLLCWISLLPLKNCGAPSTRNGETSSPVLRKTTSRSPPETVWSYTKASPISTFRCSSANLLKPPWMSRNLRGFRTICQIPCACAFSSARIKAGLWQDWLPRRWAIPRFTCLVPPAMMA